MMKSITFSWSKVIWLLVVSYMILFVLQHSKLSSKVLYEHIRVTDGMYGFRGGEYCRPYYTTLFNDNCIGFWSNWKIGSGPTFIQKEKLFLVGAMKDFRTIFLFGFAFDYKAIQLNLQYKKDPVKALGPSIIYSYDPNIPELIRRNGYDQFYYLFWMTVCFIPFLLIIWFIGNLIHNDFYSLFSYRYSKSKLSEGSISGFVVGKIIRIVFFVALGLVIGTAIFYKTFDIFWAGHFH